MSQDLLSEAARALRDSTEPSGPGAAFTRARLMASLHQDRRRRSTRRALLLPLAAILIGSTAWAGVSGRLPKLVRAVVQAVGVSVETTGPAPAVSGKAVSGAVRSARKQPVRSATSSDSLISDTSPAASSEAQTPSVDELPRAESDELPPHTAVVMRALPTAPTERRRLEPSRTASGSPSINPSLPSASSLAEEREQSLYRSAHRAHFEQHDWPTALAAWDAYLKSAHRGRFVPEALYNRALCLLRLGRTGEAIAALEPFAAGKFGSYRKREAEALIGALEPRP